MIVSTSSLRCDIDTMWHWETRIWSRAAEINESRNIWVLLAACRELVGG